MTTEHLKSAVEAGVGPIKAEMRWQRAIIFALAAVVFGPHIPAAPALATISALADPNALTHAALAVRASLHV